MRDRRRNSRLRFGAIDFILILLLVTLSGAQATKSAKQEAQRTPVQRKISRAPEICSPCIRAHMDFLASDALRGRGSATADEHIAARYIASELLAYGVQPAGDNGDYLQQVPLITRRFSVPAQLRFTARSGDEVVWKHGLDMLVLHAGQDEVSGPLQKITWDANAVSQVRKGAFVLLVAKPGDDSPDAHDARTAIAAGAVAAAIQQDSYRKQHWKEIGERLFSQTIELADSSGTRPDDKATIVMLDSDAMNQLKDVPDGTTLRLSAPEDAPLQQLSWNVVGMVPGRSPKLKGSTILFSAHLDHLGVGSPVKGDTIYNGADDDASGTSAVLELARIFGQGRKPRRTVLFALFGSEELGELGSTYFSEHPPVPLKDIAANLEFEMIGRPDPTIGDALAWLTGWDRSNLGPTLTMHGAKLVADPYPEQNFFERSDNYALAKDGVVAQTISSFGMHSDYHQPSDDLQHIDFPHLDKTIESVVPALEWLANSDFTPEWKEGGKP